MWVLQSPYSLLTVAAHKHVALHLHSFSSFNVVFDLISDLFLIEAHSVLSLGPSAALTSLSITDIHMEER